MSSINVYQATIFDLELLVPLFDGYRQFLGCKSDQDAARSFLRNRLNHGESTLFIALDQKTPIGFAQLYPTFSSLSLARTFVMNDVFVLPDSRRRGAALRLMTAAVDYAAAVGAEKISLDIASSNHPAQALYACTGWSVEENSLPYYFMVPELSEALA